MTHSDGGAGAAAATTVNAGVETKIEHGATERSFLPLRENEAPRGGAGGRWKGGLAKGGGAHKANVGWECGDGRGGW